MTITYTDIYNLEERTNDNLFEIHFYKEGDWWRAYEWSAYLCTLYPNEINDKLKATHKQCKDIDDGIIFIGMKISSFDKFLPKIGEPSLFEDEHIVYNVKEILNNNELTFEKYKTQLIEWKNSVPIKEDKNKKIFNKKDSEDLRNIPFYEVNTLEDIIKDILSYHIESRSLVENTIYLGKIKNKLSAFINLK